MPVETLALPLLVGLIAVALFFDFLNGLHDAANAIATIVATRVLRPHHAVAWAAFFNFIAFLFFGLHVAETIGTGIVDAEIVDARVIFGALAGAIAWNIITWWRGIPSSSSHALVGGILGAGTVKAGIGAIVWSGLGKTVAAIVLSPLLGLVLALLLREIPLSATSGMVARGEAIGGEEAVRLERERLTGVAASNSTAPHGQDAPDAPAPLVDPADPPRRSNP